MTAMTAPVPFRSASFAAMVDATVWSRRDMAPKHDVASADRFLREARAVLDRYEAGARERPNALRHDLVHLAALVRLHAEARFGGTEVTL